MPLLRAILVLKLLGTKISKIVYLVKIECVLKKSIFGLNMMVIFFTQSSCGMRSYFPIHLLTSKKDGFFFAQNYKFSNKNKISFLYGRIEKYQDHFSPKSQNYKSIFHLDQVNNVRIILNLCVKYILCN